LRSTPYVCGGWQLGCWIASLLDYLLVAGWQFRLAKLKAANRKLLAN